MASAKELALDWAQVRRDFKYVKSTGRLYRWNMIKQSLVVLGWTEVARKPRTDGYLEVRYMGRKFLAHRLIWFWVTGEWPDQVDHKDHVRSNNRWVNIRNATHSMNAQNLIRANVDSRTGFLGVTLRQNGKYLAQIHLPTGMKHLGIRSTPEAAQALYLAAKRKYHVGNLL